MYFYFSLHRMWPAYNRRFRPFELFELAFSLIKEANSHIFNM